MSGLQRVRPWIASALAALAVGCGGPPQMGPDPETFKAVDALFTAVSLRETPLVDRCEAQLRELQSSGKLPEPASKELAAICEEARGGRWEPAQVRLREFMKGQRR